ncbi:TPA: tetratricopeptide repeat protein, partial [Bacillus cereus]|nr:tetratricopeptide repeat protein [Bacillus cereus]
TSKIKEIEEILENCQLSNEKLRSIFINLHQFYIFSGHDEKALKIINEYNLDEMGDTITKISVLVNKLKIFRNSGEVNDTLITIDELINLNKDLHWGIDINNTVKSGLLIELGKTLSLLYSSYSERTDSEKEIQNELMVDCIEIYDELINAYENGLYSDIDHYHGALANKANVLLRQTEESTQQRGVEQMKKVVKEKLRVGNFNGVANSYSMLGAYYLRIEDYKQAIAYTKKDLALVEKFGSKREVISTLLNLTSIYLACNQINEAKMIARKALQIAEEVENSAIVLYIHNKLGQISQKAKNLNLSGINFGNNALCACNSGNLYNQCCGIADYDYTDLNKVLASSELLHFSSLIDNDFNKQKPIANLDFLLRTLKPHEIRLSWIDLVNQGAYQEVYELPDMTSLNIISAKSIINQVKTDNNTFSDATKKKKIKDIDSRLIKESSAAISACMLSVAALEAFVNQLIYFLKQIQTNDMPEFIKSKLPREIVENPLDYQRNTRFDDKLETIFDIYTNNLWKTKTKNLSKELMKLISIRNELVHFKSVEFFKIIPKKSEHLLLKNLNPKIELRDVSNSWPLRLLTLSFAEWCIDVVEQTINFVKESYQIEAIKLIR